MPPRTTRATSVARTKEAEPPSRRTRAASVSANKRPEPPKKAVATPKRKRSASAAPRARSVSKPRGDPAAKRRESGRRKSGRVKRAKIGDVEKEDGEDVEEPRGRRSERESDALSASKGLPEDEWRVIRSAPDSVYKLGERFTVSILRDEKDRRKRRNRLEVYFPQAFTDAQTAHNLRFAVCKQDITACHEGTIQEGKDGITEQEEDELIEMLEGLRTEESELDGTERGEEDATREKIEEMVGMFRGVKTEMRKHEENVVSWTGWVEKAVVGGVMEAQRKWFISRCEQLVKEEQRLVEKYGEETRKLLSSRNDITEEKLLEMRRKLENAIVLEDPKPTPKNRVRGAYSDTLERGIVKAPLSARQNRIRLKEVAEEKEKAAKEFEDLKAEFAEGMEFYEGGGTNMAMIKGYKEKMEEIRSLEEEYNEVKTEREDLEKVKAFMAKLQEVKENWSAMEKENGQKIYEETRKKLENGKEVGIIDQHVNKDGTVVEKEADFRIQDDGALVLDWAEGEVEKVASPPSTVKKTAETEGKGVRPKKTPRRKSIRMGALSIFTPGGTRANSEAVEDDPTPSSPLSPPPAERDQPQTYTLAPGLPSIRRPESISWATPVSEIQEFLVATQEANAYKDFLPGNVYGPSTEQLKKFAFHPRPIGFKCPGHKREWRGAEQTKDLIIYRDWLNFPVTKDREQLFGFFMTPRDISKPPTLEHMKSLKDWKAWGAGVLTQKEKGGVKRTLYIYDPELSGKEAEKMKKTGELTKMQQLLVGAVKRCRGGIEEVVVEGRGKETKEEKEKDSFAMTAEWANEIIGMAGMHMKERKTQSLVIGK